MKKYPFYIIILFIFSSCFKEENSKPIFQSQETLSYGIDSTNYFAIISKPDSNYIQIKKHRDNFSCFSIISPQNVLAITDPYTVNYSKPNIVTVSHDAADHKDTTGFGDNFKYLECACYYTYGDISVKGIEGYAYNNTDAVINYSYVFTIENIRIAHLGSIGRKVSGSQLGNADILMLQIVNDNSKLSTNEIMQIISETRAKIIIPMHGTQDAVESLANKLGTTIWKQTKGELFITDDKLYPIVEPMIVVLDN